MCTTNPPLGQIKLYSILFIHLFSVDGKGLHLSEEANDLLNVCVAMVTWQGDMPPW